MPTLGLFVAVLFPPAFALLALLLVPLPSILRRRAVGCVDAVLFLRLGRVTIWWACALAAGATFLACNYQLSAIYAQRETAADASDFRSATKLLKVKWRAERNWWISLFALTLWVVLRRFRSEVKHSEELTLELAAARRQQRAGAKTD